MDTAQASPKDVDGTFQAPLGICGEDYKGPAGICPHCHSRNFFLQEDGKAICCVCGIEGHIDRVDGKYLFQFDAEAQMPHAHDTISGKFIHGDDIQRNEGKARAALATEEAKGPPRPSTGTLSNPPNQSAEPPQAGTVEPDG